MIIEIIIVLLGFFGSLIGFIFFIRHYFKTWKAKSDNKKMLLAIESSDNEYACNDKFYENILDKVNVRSLLIFFFVAGLVALMFIVFAAPNKDTNNSSIGNQGVQQVAANTPLPSSQVNISLNQTEPSIMDALTKTTGIPFWVIMVLGGIIMWLILRRRHSYFL